MRHAVLAHRDLDFHARVIDLAEHFLDTPDRLAEQGRRLGEFDHHHLAGRGGAGRAFRDQDVLAVALVLERDEPDAAFLQQPPDDRLRRALDDLHHLALGPAAPVLAHHARAHLVLVQDRAHFVGGEIDVGFAVVADHETMAVAVALDRADDFVGKTGRGRHRVAIQSLAFLNAQVAELVDALVSGTSE